MDSPNDKEMPCTDLFVPPSSSTLVHDANVAGTPSPSAAVDRRLTYRHARLSRIALH